MNRDDADGNLFEDEVGWRLERFFFWVVTFLGGAWGATQKSTAIFSIEQRHQKNVEVWPEELRWAYKFHRASLTSRTSKPIRGSANFPILRGCFVQYAVSRAETGAGASLRGRESTGPVSHTPFMHRFSFRAVTNETKKNSF